MSILSCMDGEIRVKRGVEAGRGIAYLANRTARIVGIRIHGQATRPRPRILEGPETQTRILQATMYSPSAHQDGQTLEDEFSQDIGSRCRGIAFRTRRIVTVREFHMTSLEGSGTLDHFDLVLRSSRSHVQYYTQSDSICRQGSKNILGRNRESTASLSSCNCTNDAGPTATM